MQGEAHFFFWQIIIFCSTLFQNPIKTIMRCEVNIYLVLELWYANYVLLSYMFPIFKHDMKIKNNN